jgi:hypothetical protein
MKLFAPDVFTPFDFPTHTYAKRAVESHEETLRQAVATRNVISVSGPSKSGKTVLVKRVIGEENLIPVSGAEIRQADELWEKVLDWMGAPSATTEQESDSISNTLSGQASGGVDLPFVGKIGAQGGYARGSGKSTSRTATEQRRGLAQVAKEIANSEYVVFIDDFHYMGRDIQAAATRQIKAAAERGIRICCASVPHRSDDVVRSTPELRGRTTNVDTGYWKQAELDEIGHLGFGKLNVVLAKRDIERLAHEACGSPQLMQAICLNACYVLQVSKELNQPKTYAIDEDQLRSILAATSNQTDYSSMVARMHQGPKTRGTERKEFDLIDDSVGDVYRCVLVALARDPPQVSFAYSELMKRIEAVCKSEETPASSSVKEACRQLHKFALEMYPDQRIVEWDDEGGTDTLHIPDPYFLFYLRSSPKLRQLAKFR